MDVILRRDPSVSKRQSRGKLVGAAPARAANTVAYSDGIPTFAGIQGFPRTVTTIAHDHPNRTLPDATSKSLLRPSTDGRFRKAGAESRIFSDDLHYNLRSDVA